MAELKGKLLRIYESISQDPIYSSMAPLESLRDNIEYLSKNDPSKTNKYVELMMIIVLKENSPLISIINLIKRFHEINNKISTKIFENADPQILKSIPDRIIANPRDITLYTESRQIFRVCELANAHGTKKDKKEKIITEETDIIYDNDDYLIVVPLTFDASCYWGVDTKWCTTTRDNQKYFHDYVNNGTLFYIIDKYRQNDKNHPLSKFAIHIKHGSDANSGLIYNRTDDQLATGSEKVLPKRLIDILINYHNTGSVISFDDVFKIFKEYKLKCNKLEVDDDWIKIPEDTPDNVMMFKCDNFPSYYCCIKFEHNIGKKEGDVSIKWIDVIRKRTILTNPSMNIKGRDIGIHLKKKTLPNLWDTTISQILGNGKTYISVKKKFLDDIIIKYFARPEIKIMDMQDEWNFKLLAKNCGSDVFGPDVPSLTDLGKYTYQVKGNYADLNEYSATAHLDFNTNTFILLGGETDEISWSFDTRDFNLLYYHEQGMTDLLDQFKSWVIEILTTKSDRLVNDIYGDNMLKIMSKSDAFDEYLKSSDIVSKKIKPTSKGKQFFKRCEKKVETKKSELWELLVKLSKTEKSTADDWFDLDDIN